MRIQKLVVTGAVLLAFSATPGHALESGNSSPKSENILTLEHRETTLPNGLRVYLVKYPSPGVVAYQLPVHVGSRNEVEAGKTGFAHFFEHLMFRGTRKRSSKQFGDLYTRLGVENNAWTSNDLTNYHGVAASAYLQQIMDAEADRFANLSFDEKALRDEAGAVLGEYNKDVAQPEFLLEEKLAATAFKTHPYAHTTMGYKDDVLKFTERYQDVWPFFHRYYRPSNVAVIVVGDVDFNRTLAVIQKSFGAWKNPAIEPVQIPVEAPQTEARTAEVKIPTPTQTRLTVAYKVPGYTTKTFDGAALDVLAEMLFSTTSEFQKVYRFQKKWVDSVQAGSQQSVDPGLWMISLRLSESGEGKEKELLTAVEKTMASARDQLAAPERLAATKKRFRNLAITSWFSSPESLAGRIAVATNVEPDIDVLNRTLVKVDGVTPKILQEVTRALLVDAHKTTVTLHGTGK